MIIDLIFLIILIGALAVIGVIIFKKFPVLSIIDTSKIHAEKISQTKHKIISDRLKRKFFDFQARSRNRMRPAAVKISRWWNILHQKIAEIEKNYANKKPLHLLNHKDRTEHEQKINTILEDCQELFRGEQLPEAEKKCIEAITLDPKNPEAYQLLGDIYFAMKDFEHAKEVFQHLVRMGRENDEAYSHLGQIAYEKGNWQEAEEDFLKSINLNTQASSHHLDLCRVYQSLGDFKKALCSCQEAVRLEPNNPKNLSVLLEVAINLKDKYLAYETFKKIKEVNPENQKLGELESRIKELEKTKGK